MTKEEMTSSNNDFGIAALVFGVLSIVLFFTVIPSIVLGILALIFGFVQRKKAKNKWALTGIILSIIGIILSLGLVWLIVSTFREVSSLLQSCINDPTLPGCEDVLKYLNQQQLGAQYG